MLTERGYHYSARYGYFNIVKLLHNTDYETNNNFYDCVEFSDYLWDHTRAEMIAEGYQDDGDDVNVADRLHENLAYYTIYYEPDAWNEGVAITCGLTPFTYSNNQGTIYLLALGGYGMDLTPKLDAYQALVQGTISPDSFYFKQRDYFVSVVGENVTQRVDHSIMKQWRYLEHTRLANQVP